MTELLEKYPKAAKIVREYYLEQLLESLKEKSLPEEFKEHVREQGITNETISGIISGNPRLLFDVFDENEIFIQIGITIKEKWNYLVNDLMISNFPNIPDVGNPDFKSRKEAEQAAVEEAFKLLEEKL